MRTDPPPWQLGPYRAAMTLAGAVYPTVRRLRSTDLPYPERLAAMRGAMPRDIRAIAAEAPHGTLWVHGVSVGEALAAQPLVARWRDEGIAGVPLIFTTTTNGGFRLANEKFPLHTAITFFPLDAPGAMRRAFEALKPRVLVIYETELWPSLIAEAKRRDVKLLLANARVSDRASTPPPLARLLLAWCLRQFDALIPQSPLDERRLRALGARDDQLLPIGNVKFDAAGEPPSPEERAERRARLGIAAEAPVFVAASTHPGEEALVLEALAQLRIAMKDLVCLIAPRHLERVEEVAALLREHNVPFVRYSALKARAPQEPVTTILVDTLGDLLGLYGLADVALVGGSLIQRGGHNVLEPAAQGCAVLHGPSVENFRALVELLTLAGAAQLVTRETLAPLIRGLLTNPPELAERRARALALIAEHRGATSRILEWCRTAFGES